MKLYKHEGEGVCGMGSTIIVQAANKKEAKKIIKLELDNIELKGEKLKVVKLSKYRKIIYLNNGDNYP